MEAYPYLKAMHLIFVVTWFAGLFYMPRLFIYHIEAEEKNVDGKKVLTDQLKVMSKRLWYIITWPSAILCIGCAVTLLILNPAWLQQSWMHLKLLFVGLLIGYHLKCHFIFRDLQNDKMPHSSKFIRIWNEVATLLLFALVFLAVLKNSLNWIFGVVGLLVLGVLLMLGIKLYKKTRKD